MYHYEGKLNGIENTIVLLGYPENSFGTSNTLRTFLSTDVSLSTEDILSYYVCRWQFHMIAETGKTCSFENGYHQICDIIQLEKYRYLFQCARESNDFNSFMKLAG